jgi:hypothetical protein
LPATAPPIMGCTELFVNTSGVGFKKLPSR